MSHAIRTVAVPRSVPPLFGFIAGFVDICAFLGLFHIFVAQLTGSFVYAGAELVAPHAQVLAISAIPVFFVAGCLAAAIAVERTPRGHALAWVLGLECILLTLMLAAMLVLPLNDANAPGVVAAALLGIAAMGVQSAMVRLFMHGVPSTNVMTTNTTQLAIDSMLVFLSRARQPEDAAAAKQQRDARERLSLYWPPMASFMAGTAIGALCYRMIGNAALIAPLVIAYGLLTWCIHRDTVAARA